MLAEEFNLTMTTLLWCLVYLSFLPIVWSMVGAAVRARQDTGLDNSHPRRQAATLTGLGERAYAAHQNAWEALMMFTPAAFIATITGADAASTALAGITFCVARTLHGVLYCMNLATLRSLVWIVGVGTIIYLIVLSV